MSARGHFVRRGREKIITLEEQLKFEDEFADELGKGKLGSQPQGKLGAQIQEKIDAIGEELMERVSYIGISDRTPDPPSNNSVSKIYLPPISSSECHVILDNYMCPKECNFVKISAPKRNLIYPIFFNEGFYFVIDGSEPLTYKELYSQLELSKITSVQITFLKNQDRSETE